MSLTGKAFRSTFGKRPISYFLHRYTYTSLPKLYTKLLTPRRQVSRKQPQLRSAVRTQRVCKQSTRPRHARARSPSQCARAPPTMLGSGQGVPRQPGRPRRPPPDLAHPGSGAQAAFCGLTPTARLVTVGRGS